MNIRLEYSQDLGQFNQAEAADQADITDGYKMVCCFTNSERASRFVTAMISKYPALNKRDQNRFPTLELMKEELLLFLEEDIRLLNEHMKQTFKRRKSLYSNPSN